MKVNTNDVAFWIDIAEFQMFLAVCRVIFNGLDVPLTESQALQINVRKNLVNSLRSARTANFALSGMLIDLLQQWWQFYLSAETCHSFDMYLPATCDKSTLIHLKLWSSAIQQCASMVKWSI